MEISIEIEATSVTTEYVTHENEDKKIENEMQQPGTVIESNVTEDDTVGAETPHEESDYEDNIAVTVPPAHLQNRVTFRGHMNGRHSRHMKQPGLEDTPPKPHHHIQVVC